MQDKKVKYPILRKRIIYQQDSNNGNYQSNTLNFDLSQFANVNSGELLDFSNAELQLPLIYTLQSPTAVAGPAEGLWDYRLGPKNGAWNMIHSANIQYANREVLSASASYLNAVINFRVLTTWSASDIKQYGTQCLWALDTPSSWQWNTKDVGTTGTNLSRLISGNGLCNNFVLPTFTGPDTVSAPAVLATVNKFYGRSGFADCPYGNRGLVARMRMINDKLTVSSAPAYDENVFDQNAEFLRGVTAYNNELKNYCTEIINPGAATNAYMYWVVLASIPLKFISPFFESLSLTRSAYVKLSLQINNGYVVVSNPASANSTAAQTCKSSDIGFQNTCPIMIASRLDGANHAVATTSVLATANVVTPYSCNVAGFTNPASQAIQVKHPLGACRVTVPCYELNPDDAAEYLSANTAKTISWESYYTNTLSNVSPSGNVDYMITNGSNNITGVLCIPMVAGTVNGASDATFSLNAVSPFAEARSPFSASPAQPSPGASYLNAQVLVGGKNILGDIPVNYNHEHFMLNMREVGKINGGDQVGLCVAEGLSLKDWSDGYRYLYAVNRDADSKANVSVQIKFVNASLVAHDYLFVLFRKQSMTINVANGMVIE
jgi:hypothetical protein